MPAAVIRDSTWHVGLKLLVILRANFGAEDVDPNTHLQGAFSLASREGAIAEIGGNALLAAGFWNYLREDITFSLFQGCPLKMDLSTAQVPTFSHGDNHLHSVSLILGRIVNAALGQQIEHSEWQSLFTQTTSWIENLPKPLLPFSDVRPKDEILPQVRFLVDFHGIHGSSSQYNVY